MLNVNISCCSSAHHVRLHQVGGFCGQTLLLVDVVPDVAEFLLQHTHGLEVGGVVEGVAAQQKELMLDMERKVMTFLNKCCSSGL